MNDQRSNEWTHPEGNMDDNMHDPRRAEVPEMDGGQALQDASTLVKRVREGTLGPVAIAELLLSVYGAGAIAGMKAQYEHDQKVASQH